MVLHWHDARVNSHLPLEMLSVQKTLLVAPRFAVVLGTTHIVESAATSSNVVEEQAAVDEAAADKVAICYEKL